MVPRLNFFADVKIKSSKRKLYYSQVIFHILTKYLCICIAMGKTEKQNINIIVFLTIVTSI